MRFLKSLQNAFNGIGILIRTERNFQIHLAILVLVISAAFYYDIPYKKYGVILMVSALVLSLEAINTAIEKLCDAVTDEKKESIRVIKDISAGAVLIATIFAITIGITIFLPYMIRSAGDYNLQLF